MSDMAGTGAGGGETAKDPSGFTVDTIHQYIDAILSERDRRYEQRFQNQEQAIAAALAASQAVLIEHDKRYEQRFQGQENNVGLALSRVDKEFHEHIQQVRTETQAALEAAEKAIAKAETATDKRFESVNEFRAQLADQAGRFMPRDESINRHDATADKISDLDRRQRADIALVNSRLDLAAGAGAGVDRSRQIIAWAIAAVLGLISIVIAANAYIGR